MRIAVDQFRDAVQRIEEEVRLELHLQRIRARFREARAEFQLTPFAFLRAAVEMRGVADAEDHQVHRQAQAHEEEQAEVRAAFARWSAAGATVGDSPGFGRLALAVPHFHSGPEAARLGGINVAHHSQAPSAATQHDDVHRHRPAVATPHDRQPQREPEDERREHRPRQPVPHAHPDSPRTSGCQSPDELARQRKGHQAEDRET